jgi:hypothetical protein
MIRSLALNWIINISNVDGSVVSIRLIKETRIHQALEFHTSQVREWKKTGNWTLECHRDEMTVNAIHMVDLLQIILIKTSLLMALMQTNNIGKPPAVVTTKYSIRQKSNTLTKLL